MSEAVIIMNPDQLLKHLLLPELDSCFAQSSGLNEIIKNICFTMMKNMTETASYLQNISFFLLAS